jgi:outer membrane protein
MIGGTVARRSDRKLAGKAEGRKDRTAQQHNDATIHRLCVIMLAAGLLSPNIGTAQEVPRYLTLQDALALARQRNPAFRRVVAQADASGADVRAATGSFLPNLSANLQFQASRSTVATGQDDFGGNIELPESRTIARSYSSQGLSSQLTLFDGFQNLNGLKSAKAGAQAAQWGVDAQATVIEGEVKRRFYEVIRWQRRIAIEERLLIARNDELLATDRLFRVAAREQVDVLGAQVEVARQEQSLESARGEARKALLVLAEAIGREEGADFQVVGDFPEVSDPGTLDADAVVERVLQWNPKLQQAAASAAQARLAADRARGMRWPTITANATFSRNVGQDGYGGMFQLNPQDRSFGIGFTVSLPLFTRFSTSQAIAQADASREVETETLRETRLQLEREARSALIDVQNSHRQLELAERTAELGRQRLAMAQEQYQLGSRSFTELQQIVNTSANDERSALVARLNYVNAVIGLEELVGGPLRP